MNEKNTIPTNAAKVSTIVDKKKVYICSPLRPVSTDPILRANELIDNLKLAKDACTFAALRSCDPVAPHLYYPQFLNDNDPTERELGMELGLKALRTCEELWIISPRISSGMSAEIKEAQKCGILVLVFTAAGFRKYTGNGDMTDNCYADTADGVIDYDKPTDYNMTLRELLSLLPSTKGKSVPTPKALKNSAAPVVSYTGTDISLTVYNNGFALARDTKRYSVFRVDACKDYHYDTEHADLASQKNSATKPDIDFEEFLDMPWTVRLMLTASDKLEENNDQAAHRAIAVHPSAAADVNEYNKAAHGKSVEDQVISKMMKEEMLQKLTDKQREVFTLYYEERYTQQEIGRMLHLTTSSVNQRLKSAVAKIRKYMAENQ